MHVHRHAYRFVTLAATLMVSAAAAPVASAQLVNTGVGTLTGQPSAGSGLGQGIAVGTATTLTRFGFWLGTAAAGTNVKYLIWDGTSNSLAYSQTRTLASATADNTLQLSDPFAFNLLAGRTYFFGIVADQEFTVSANLVPGVPTSANGLTFDDPNVVFDGFDDPTTSTGIDDRGGASLALQLYGTQAAAVVPEPGTVALVGAGLAAVGAVTRRRRVRPRTV